MMFICLLSRRHTTWYHIKMRKGKLVMVCRGWLTPSGSGRAGGMPHAHTWGGLEQPSAQCVNAPGTRAEDSLKPSSCCFPHFQYCKGMLEHMGQRWGSRGGDLSTAVWFLTRRTPRASRVWVSNLEGGLQLLPEHWHFLQMSPKLFAKLLRADRIPGLCFQWLLALCFKIFASLTTSAMY